MKKQIIREILEILEQASYGTAPFEKLPEPKQSMIVSKLQLKRVIELGYITDVEKAEKWLELIELVYEWTMDATFDCEHRLFFNEGTVEIDSISEYYGGDWVLDYKGGQLLLDGEEFGDSITQLLNYIESCL